MRVVRKTITLTNSQNDGIKEQIGAGYYVDDSEDIRDLIRQEREHNAEPRSFLLIEGGNGGEPQPFVPTLFKERMRTKHAGFISVTPYDTAVTRIPLHDHMDASRHP